MTKFRKHVILNIELRLNKEKENKKCTSAKNVAKSLKRLQSNKQGTRLNIGVQYLMRIMKKKSALAVGTMILKKYMNAQYAVNIILTMNLLAIMFAMSVRKNIQAILMLFTKHLTIVMIEWKSRCIR